MVNARNNAEQEALQQEVKTLSVSIPQPNVDHTKEIASNSKAIEKTHSTLTTLTQNSNKTKRYGAKKFRRWQLTQRIRSRAIASRSSALSNAWTPMPRS
jgi:hypothetical protein